MDFKNIFSSLTGVFSNVIGRQLDKKTQDPFEKTEVACVADLILQHLTPKETLRISEVSHRWWNVVSDSKSCCEKIVLALDLQHKQGANSKLLRNYRHVKIVTKKVTQIAAGNVFYAVPTFAPLLAISNSLQSLEVESGLIFGFCAEEFSELSELKIHYLTNCLRINFKGKAPKLKTLAIEDAGENSQVVCDFVSSFFTLECLVVSKKLFTKLFEKENSVKLKLRLQKLKLTNKKNVRTESNKNFVKFLSSQADTLIEVEFENMLHSTLVNAVVNNTRIERLTVDYIDEPADLSADPNQHITNVVIRNDQRGMVALLASLPNVTYLYVQRLRQDIVDFAARRNLKEISFNSKGHGCHFDDILNTKFRQTIEQRIGIAPRVYSPWLPLE